MLGLPWRKVGDSWAKAGEGTAHRQSWGSGELGRTDMTLRRSEEGWRGAAPAENRRPEKDLHHCPREETLKGGGHQEHGGEGPLGCWAQEHNPKCASKLNQQEMAANLRDPE